MIAQYLGFDSDYMIIGLAAVCMILLIMIIVNMTQISKLKKKYNKFMSGKNAKSLEDTLIKRLDQVDTLMEANKANEKSIKKLFADMKFTFQKIGLVKYDAYNQMGGNLSFCLCMLNERNSGFILNSVHSSDGCYTYTKEIKNGECEIALGEEERKALNMAIGF